MKLVTSLKDAEKDIFYCPIFIYNSACATLYEFIISLLTLFVALQRSNGFLTEDSPD